MKLKFLPFLLLTLLAACGGSNDEPGDNPAPQHADNTNSNFDEANPVTHRMEFPRVKGGTSAVITHYDNGEVNYSVEWDTSLRSCRWSAYEIYASNRETHTSRYYVDRNNDSYNRQYPTDPDFHNSAAWTAGNGDPFWGSGFDHGHMCPSADRLNSANANYQTFYLTNMMPQVNGFNAGVWSNMEAWVRNQITTRSRDTLFVVKGGTIDNADQVQSTKVHGMVIPRYYYMAVLMHNSQGYKAMGFWIEHRANSTNSIGQYVVNIDRLEQLTGIDFFCNLPDDTENHVEGLDIESVKRAWGFQ